MVGGHSLSPSLVSKTMSEQDENGNPNETNETEREVNGPESPDSEIVEFVRNWTVIELSMLT